MSAVSRTLLDLDRRLALLRLGAMALGASSLVGCGFRLRQPLNLPYRQIVLVGFDSHSLMAKALRVVLPRDIAVTESVKQADVVITNLQEGDFRTVASTTAAGQVTGLQLRVLFRYRLTTPDGRILMNEGRLEQARSLTYTENWALAKATEEVDLREEMRNDIAAQLLRVLDKVSHMHPVEASAEGAASSPTGGAQAR